MGIKRAFTFVLGKVGGTAGFCTEPRILDLCFRRLSGRNESEDNCSALGREEASGGSGIWEQQLHSGCFEGSETGSTGALGYEVTEDPGQGWASVFSA